MNWSTRLPLAPSAARDPSRSGPSATPVSLGEASPGVVSSLSRLHADALHAQPPPHGENCVMHLGRCRLGQGHQPVNPSACAWRSSPSRVRCSSGRVRPANPHPYPSVAPCTPDRRAADVCHPGSAGGRTRKTRVGTLRHPVRSWAAMAPAGSAGWARPAGASPAPAHLRSCCLWRDLSVGACPRATPKPGILAWSCRGLASGVGQTVDRAEPVDGGGDLLYNRRTRAREIPSDDHRVA